MRSIVCNFPQGTFLRLPNGVSERKTVRWTVFREAVLPKARSTGRAARRTTCTTMRRRARWGTAEAVEGATIHVPLAWQADYILRAGRADYIHGFAAITYAPTAQLHTKPQAAWTWKRRIAARKTERGLSLVATVPASFIRFPRLRVCPRCSRRLSSSCGSLLRCDPCAR